ncbi:MAG: orotidine-5'-phosphate decarboxylase [Acidobacteria bacterium]|nr:orotidine-5'-phosphate decarboxylase [Acidobacteriota bacterium]
MTHLSKTSESDDGYLLSRKPIPVRERLIFALDVPTVKEAENIVETLGESVQFYKLGLEIFMAGGYYELIDRLHARGKKTFVDLKFFDVPNTVASAVRQLKDHRPEFATVHGSDQILKAACAEKNETKILAVTVLTSLDQADVKALGFRDVDIEEIVYSRAKRALEIGCDGVISSGLEAPKLRKDLGNNFLIVVPGIRPVENREIDDQKRTIDVEDAFINGADYIVVGRPIKNAPDPEQAAEAIQSRIARLFNS